MNTVVASDCAAAEPMIALWNGFRRFERLAISARLAIAGDAFQPDYLPSVEIAATSADDRQHWRPTEILRRRMGILIADIAGYSRLIEADDVGTVARLRWLRREIVDPAAALFHAALTRHTADAILLAFADPMDAIGCAITLQSVLFLLNEGLPDGQTIRLRVGLSVGEVLLVDGDVHGTSVNIAARLEGLADPGEIYLCERAYAQVRHTLPRLLEPAGERWLHNISTPVRTFRVAVGVVASIARQGALPAAADFPVRSPGYPEHVA
jgi:adenylate cyclase